MGSERVHKDNSSWHNSFNNDTSKSQSKKHSSPIPNSSLPEEIPSYSRASRDLISAKLLKTADTKVETQTPPEIQTSSSELSEKSTEEAKHQSQRESGAAEENPNSPEENNQPDAPIQTKLTIGSPGDKYEQEADKMAQQVMSMDTPTANSQIIQPSSE